MYKAMNALLCIFLFSGRGKLNIQLTFRIIIILLIMCFSSPVFSQEAEAAGGDDPVFILGEETGEESEPETGSLVPVWEFIRMLIILGCVVGVIYLFFFFLKKGMKKKLPENDILRVITTTRLQGNDILYLVQVGYHYFLIGSGGNGLSLISQITDKETIDTIMLHATEEPGLEKQGFADILLKIFKPGQKQNGLVSNPINFMKKQQERLSKLK
jgi:flagellar biogenesis protein FliO